MQCFERFIQSGSFSECSGLAVVDIEVIAADSGGKKILDLPVGLHLLTQ